jgi:hypothetical protein
VGGAVQAAGVGTLLPPVPARGLALDERRAPGHIRMDGERAGRGRELWHTDAEGLARPGMLE